MSQCCVNPGIRADHKGNGDYKTINGVHSYVTGTGSVHIVFMTDIFGPQYINTQLLADQLAAGVGATVYVPDLFNGGAMDPQDKDLWGKLPEWLKSHGPEHGSKIAFTVLDELTQSNQVHLIGTCYGAAPIIAVLKNSKYNGKIKSIVLSHPSFLTKDDADAINVPVYINEAEQDQMFTPEIRQHYHSVLEPKKLLQSHFYPGTKHGWTVRPDDEKSTEQQKIATQNTINFFKSQA